LWMWWGGGSAVVVVRAGSAWDDRTVKLLDAGSGALLQTLEGHSDVVHAAAFSPNGKTLASASYDKTVKLWDAGSGALLQTLKDHSDVVNAVAFSPNGKTLASASYDKTVKLWDSGSGALLQTLEGHSDLVKAAAFSPDGKTLASASYDGTVKLCDVGSGALLQMLNADGVTTLSFSADGTQLQTNRGSFHVPSPSSTDAVVPRQQPYSSIFVKDQWVCSRIGPMLWLPPEYRPHCIVVRGLAVGLGYTFGRVIIMGFAPPRPPSC
jgi:WD40 repeat protein